MKILFVDTETTGLPLWKEPSDHPEQPHIVDIAADLFQDDGTLLASLDAIINNPGVIIPDEVAAIHGITTEIAQAEGQDPAIVFRDLVKLVKEADLIVGHNISFDIRMVRILGARVTGEKWECNLPTFDTMRKSTSHCRILGEKARHPKDWKCPKLSEAIRHFFDEEMPDAHRARPDMEGSRRIYFHLKSLNGVN